MMPPGTAWRPGEQQCLAREGQGVLALAAGQRELGVVELELQPAGVLPALAVGEVVERHAQPGGEGPEQLGAGAALAALDPRQVGHRGVRTRQLGLGQPRGDAGRLDPSAEQHGVERGQLPRELGRHVAHLASYCPEKRQVPEIGDAVTGVNRLPRP